MSRSSNDSLARLAAVIESRKPAAGGDPDKSYVARLLHKGPDAFLKKVGEEATEVVMAAKDLAHGPADAAAGRAALVGEVADLWFQKLLGLKIIALRLPTSLQLPTPQAVSGTRTFWIQVLALDTECAARGNRDVC